MWMMYGFGIAITLPTWSQAQDEQNPAKTEGFYAQKSPQVPTREFTPGAWTRPLSQFNSQLGRSRAIFADRTDHLLSSTHKAHRHIMRERAPPSTQHVTFHR